MEKYRPAIIAGGGAFALSLLVALVSGVGAPALVLRPLIFGAGFFLFGLGAALLFRKFLAAGLEETGKVGGGVDVSVDDDDAGGLGIGAFGFGEDGQGVEQNTAMPYTGNEEGIGDSFKPMDFNVLNEPSDARADTFENMPRPVDPPLAGNQTVFARVPEADSVANADPQKLAGTIQSLLLDDE
jgi:hypothetical protein